MTTLKTGDKAPDFAVEDQDGNLIKLSDFKGKKIILNIFISPNKKCPLRF